MGFGARLAILLVAGTLTALHCTARVGALTGTPQPVREREGMGYISACPDVPCARPLSACCWRGVKIGARRVVLNCNINYRYGLFCR